MFSSFRFLPFVVAVATIFAAFPMRQAQALMPNMVVANGDGGAALSLPSKTKARQSSDHAGYDKISSGKLSIDLETYISDQKLAMQAIATAWASTWNGFNTDLDPCEWGSEVICSDGVVVSIYLGYVGLTGKLASTI